MLSELKRISSVKSPFHTSVRVYARIRTGEYARMYVCVFANVALPLCVCWLSVVWMMCCTFSKRLLHFNRGRYWHHSHHLAMCTGP